MNIDKLIKEIGGMDSAFIEEALEYGAKKKRGGIKMLKRIVGIAAIAACAAFIVGAAAIGYRKNADLPIDPPDSEVIIDRSFIDRLADDEEYIVGDFIGKSIEQNGLQFVLKEVKITKKLPNGISVDDLSRSVGLVMSEWELGGNGSAIGKPDGSNLAADIKDFLDAEGRFIVPEATVKDKVWVFVTVDITNMSRSEFRDMFNGMILKYGKYGEGTRYSGGYQDENGDIWLNEMITFNDYGSWSAVGYMSEHDYLDSYEHYEAMGHMTREEIIEAAKSEDYYRILLVPDETKTVTFGYMVNTDEIGSDMALQTSLGYMIMDYHQPLPDGEPSLRIK